MVKFGFFDHRGSTFSFRYHRSRIILDRSCRTGNCRCDGWSCLLPFVCLDRRSRWDYLAFCSYRRCLFMVDGSRFYYRNRKPLCHSPLIRNLSPFPDGWGSWLHGWFSCMSGICMVSEIFRLLCSNRAFMDRSRPFGCFGSCLFAAVLPVPVPPCVLQWSVCGFLPVRSAVRLWQFGSGSRWK